MEAMTEKELSRVRLRFIDLIKSFFFTEPEAEKMSRWRGIFASLDGEHINLQFDAAVTECVQHLNDKNLKDLEDEYYALFTDPFTEEHVATSASFYIDGRHHGQTLADFRGLLAEAGLAKDKDVVETEDSLVIMLDSLARLIEEEDSKDCARAYQTQLITKYLEPLVDDICKVLDAHNDASFYASCGKFLKGYLDLERGLIMEL